MKTWDIWIEGYAATGEHGTAELFAAGVEAKTFRAACVKAVKAAQARGEDWGAFNVGELSLWECRLFDNEADARESFG